jgi:hypothetical protein
MRKIYNFIINFLGFYFSILEKGQEFYFIVRPLGTLLYSDKEELKNELMDEIRKFEIPNAS